MKFAAGAWLFVLGYALVYTGVSWFVGGNAPSLASSLGITTLQPSVQAVKSSAAVGSVVSGVSPPTASTLQTTSRLM